MRGTLLLLSLRLLHILRLLIRSLLGVHFMFCLLLVILLLLLIVGFIWVMMMMLLGSGRFVNALILVVVS